jgi:hypothetical protein
MVRTSERSSFTTCRWRWDVEFNMRLKPRRPSTALRFGTLMHRSLANFYRVGSKRGPHPKRTYLRLYKKDVELHDAMGFTDDDGKWHNMRDIGAYMFEGYIDKYGDDGEWEVLATEMPFQVDVHHPDTGRYLFTYVGTLDGVWRHVVTKEIWIPDHKSTSGDATKIDNLWIDEQAGAYWTFGVDYLKQRGIIKPKHDLRGMLFNIASKATRDEREQGPDGLYLNQDGTVSKRQPPPRFYRDRVYRDDTNRAHARQRAIEQVHEMYLIRRGKLAAYKIPGPLHNPHCRGCPVKDACELHESGADYQPLLDNMVSWDPYSEHALYERN